MRGTGFQASLLAAGLEPQCKRAALCGAFFLCSREEKMTTTTAELTGFLTQQQVADMLQHQTTATLRWWRHEDRGPRSMRVGKRVLYRRTDVERWLEVQEAETARGGVR
jgi:hypothetical protein